MLALVLFSTWLLTPTVPKVYAGDADLISGLGGRVIKDEEIIIGDRGDKILSYENETGNLLYSFKKDYEMWDEIAAGDVNGDGKDEIIHADRSSDKIYIFDRNGNELARRGGEVEAGDDIACGDVNGDGKEEIVFADRDDWIKIYDQHFNELSKFRIDFSDEDNIAVGDIDGDGVAEIFWADHDKNMITIYDMYGNSLGGFSTKEDYSFDFSNRDEMAVGDVNLDGMGELVIASRDSDNYGQRAGIYVFKFEKEGGQYKQREISYFRIGFSKGDRLAVGDVNRDGVDEIVWASQSGRIKVYDMGGSLLNGPDGFKAHFEHGAGLAVGDVDGNSITVGEPIHSTMSVTNKVIAVINSPPVDFDVINKTGIFYATYMTKNTQTMEVSVKAVTDMALSVGLSGKISSGVASAEFNLGVKVSQKFEATRGKGHIISDTHTITADMADAILTVSTDYDIYEFPIISPPELAVIDGEHQYILVTVPKGKPHIHLSNYNSSVHTIGDINSYPTRAEELPNYELSNELFKYTIEVGKVTGGKKFSMSDFNWRETKNTFSLSVSAGFKQSTNALFGSYTLSVQGNYGRSKITTHKVSISNETELQIEYKGRITDKNKWYNATAVAYLDSEDGHLVLDFYVPSKGNYYAIRELSPLGFQYAVLQNSITSGLPPSSLFNLNPSIALLVSALSSIGCSVQVEPEEGKVPFDALVQTSASGGGGVKQWRLDFGDGTVLENTGEMQSNYTHRYSEPGDYVVSLYVEGVWGANNTCTQSVTVLPNKEPTAMFTNSPELPKAGEDVSFSDSSSDEDGSIVSWSWDFGDGSTSTERNPKHTYSDPGTYTVILTIEDDGGMKASYSKQITVSPANVLPTADFTFLPKEPKAGEEINFVDKSYDSDGSIVSWSWDFGDGSTSEDAEPVHVFTEAGNYTVTLTVRDDKGGEDVKRFTITVKEAQAPTPTETTTTSTPSETTTSSSPSPASSTSETTSSSPSPSTTSSSTTQETSSTPSTQTQTSSAAGGTCGVGLLAILSLVPLLLRRRR